MIPVTLLIPTRNEAANIRRCLLSARELVDQIFVIDSESQDETIDIARQYADDVVTLTYVHNAIIPWIYQWGLDNLPIRNEWVLILEADQEISTELRHELQSLFSQHHISENGFYIQRKQIFRGRALRFGGYGAKYMLKLFRRTSGELDVNEQDTRIYVNGTIGKLKHPIIEENQNENAILFYLQKHLRYAEAFATEEFQRRNSRTGWKLSPSLFGTPDQRILRLKSLYYRSPLYVRPFAYFVYRYIFLLGFLDGKQGAIFHFLQAFWFRLIVDIRLEELQRTMLTAQPTNRNAASVDERST